jgi:hypothetical protein
MKPKRELIGLSNNGTAPAKRDERRPVIARSMLPQWTLEMIRPVVGAVSRVLWKIEFTASRTYRTARVIIAANHQTYIDPFGCRFRSNGQRAISRGARRLDGPSSGDA